MRPTLLIALAAGLLTAAFLLPAPAQAQPPDTLAAVLPAGIVYDGTAPLPAETVERWRAVPIVAEAMPDYAQDAWVDARGVSWGVTTWERVYNVALDGGGRALLYVGATRDPGLAFVTVAYESRAEQLADGRIAWHCLRAVIVRRADVE